MGFVVNYPPATNVTVNDDGTQVTVAAAGPQGPQGNPGVVAATAPITYDSGTQTVGIDQSGLTVAQSQVTGLVSDLADMTAAVVGQGHNSTLSVDVVDRMTASSNGATSSGTMYFMFFTAPDTITVSQISMMSATTAAASVTLMRMGLYAFDNTWTLVAQTANDPTLFTTTNTIFTRSFDTSGGYPSSYTLQRGVRYAATFLGVAGTMPRFYQAASLISAVAGLEPRLTGVVPGLSDFPATRSSFSNSNAPLWVRLS